jgi:hypothetical protein
MVQTSHIFLVAVALYHFVSYAFRLLRQKLFIKNTAVPDLHFLGEARPNGQKLPGTAVICGGRQVTVSIMIATFEFTYIVIHLASLVW